MLNTVDRNTYDWAEGPRPRSGDRTPLWDPNTRLDTSLRATLTRAMRAAGALIRARVIEPMRRRARRRAAMTALMQMSDYHLKDIGLTRSEIKAAVYGELPLDRQPSTVLNASLPPRRRTAPARSAGRRSAKPASGIRGRAAEGRLTGSRFPKPGPRRRRRRTRVWQDSAIWL